MSFTSLTLEAHPSFPTQDASTIPHTVYLYKTTAIDKNMGKHFIQRFISRDETVDTDENASKSLNATYLFAAIQPKFKDPLQYLSLKSNKLMKSFALVPT